MKVNKTQGMLFIFDMLKSKGFINKEEIIEQLEISNLTFKRYMQELRAFIYNFNTQYELIYVRSENKYYLKKWVEYQKLMPIDSYTKNMYESQ